MEDLAKQLSALLDSPEGMDRIKSLAESLLGGESSEDEQTTQASSSGGETLSNGELETFMKLSKLLGSAKEDDRSRLLLALRPHLSPERQGKVDKAVKLLKLIELWPILKESGLDLF